MKRVDLYLGGYPAGGCQTPGRGSAHVEDRGEIGAAHQPLRVDVRVKKLAAERFELANGIDRGEGQRGSPAVDDNVASSAIHGGNNLLDSHGVDELLRELQIGPSILEQRRTGDDLSRPCSQKLF